MTVQAPISVCMIVKNEPLIEQCLKSIRPYVNEICIVDTGSTDGTQTICKTYADRFEIFTDCNDQETSLIENFAQARQRSFELASNDWCMWIDGDDEVKDAEKLADFVAQKDIERNGNPYLCMFPYEYSRDNEGNVNCYHWRERLVTPGKFFKWVSPVHEVLTPTAAGTIMDKRDDVATIIHHRDTSGKIPESGRNLRILKKHYEKVGDGDIRLLYYLGLEYGNSGDLGNSIKFHKRYIELSGWDDEKFLACLKVAEHYQSMGQYEDAVVWGLKSLTIREGWGEGYFNLGRSYYCMAQRGGPEARRNWEKAIYFFRQGLASPPTETILFVNPLERTYDVHRYLNLALNNVGDVMGALNSTNEALKVKPNDEGLAMNKKLYEVHLSKCIIIDHIQKLVKHEILDDTADGMIRSILDGKLKMITSKEDLPQLPANDSVIQETIADLPETNPVIELPNNKFDIVLYVGFGCEPWNPDTIAQKGIGGSETAAMEMSKRLVKLGHKVRLYGDCPGLEGNFDGVEYIHYTKFRNIKCDILITSRRPHVVDDEFGVEAKLTLCWVHDVHCGSALNHTRSLRIDKFLCLSNWHKDFFLGTYKFVHPSQVIVTRNGIDLSRFDDKSVVRNPHRAVYSSSPDRGMEVIVRLWPRVREQVPDAELHVFYGFETWEVSARSCNDQGQLGLISTLKQLLKNSEQYGVFYHGRVDQIQLAREYLQSGVWPYSTWFSETSNISAMEAQAAGLRIITSPIAATLETVGSRGVMIQGNWLSEEYGNAFLEATVKAMLDPEVPGERESLQQYARDNFSWDSLAKEWSENLFPNLLNEIEQNIVPPYQSFV
jgi:glycosyltransferase involved in cell wall biosynthesis